MTGTSVTAVPPAHLPSVWQVPTLPRAPPAAATVTLATSAPQMEWVHKTHVLMAHMQIQQDLPPAHLALQVSLVGDWCFAINSSLPVEKYQSSNSSPVMAEQ